MLLSQVPMFSSKPPDPEIVVSVGMFFRHVPTNELHHLVSGPPGATYNTVILVRENGARRTSAHNLTGCFSVVNIKRLRQTDCQCIFGLLKNWEMVDGGFYASGLPS